MTLEQLESFLAVTAAGSFHAAARRQNISQPTLSARVRALEQRLNRTLFQRARSGVTLTAAGASFYPHAVAAVQSLTQGQQQARLDQRFAATIALGVQFYMWPEVVEPWLNIMEDEAPDLAVRIEPDYSAGIMDQLVGGMLDLGILFEPRLSSQVTIEPLSDETLWLVSTEPYGPDDPWDEDFVGVYWGAEFHAEFSRAFPDHRQPRLSVGLSSIALAYILEHGGSAVLFARSVESDVAQGRLHRIPTASKFSRPVFLAFRNALSDTPHLSTAIAALKQIMTTPNEATR